MYEELKETMRGWRSSERPALKGIGHLSGWMSTLPRRAVSLTSQAKSRPAPMSDLMAQLYDANPYRGFYKAIGKDVQTWGGNKEIFGVLVDQVRPRLVVEVGSWKGGSAISMASRIRNLDLPGQVLCVDTWLGSLEHWTAKGDQERRNYYESLRLDHGYPQLYYQFIVNIINAGLEDYVVPFPTTSQTAAKWLKAKSIQADLIYIDAGHDEDDVYADLTSYYELLTLDGVLFGDDWQWAGVELAVKRFADERGLTWITVENDTMWILKDR